MRCLTITLHSHIEIPATAWSRKKKFRKWKVWWCGTYSTAHTLFYRYVECNAKFLNPSNGIVDTQYRLPNERSLTVSELFYIICWHYTIWQRGAVGRTSWQLTFDMDQNRSEPWGQEDRRHHRRSRTIVSGKLQRCGGKVSSSFHL